MNYKSEKIAHELLSIGAVFLRPSEPFTWASGIKSPIYTDNRLTLSDPKVRNLVEDGLCDIIREQFAAADILMGTATAGIAHAAICAHILGTGMGYVRGGNKDHGRKNRIEGRLSPGDKTVVVEDLISTGGSLIDTVLALREAGANVLGAASIFSYKMTLSEKRLREEGIKSYSLCSLDTLIDVAESEGYITKIEGEKILKFRDNPGDESWIV